MAAPRPTTPLSWNEIKDRALRFSKEWETESSEDAEAKSFLDGFFQIFGVSRRRLATFEERVKKEAGKDGFIDLLWKGVILVEMKSRGRDLDRAFAQAKGYFPGLKDYDLPRFILVCDFERFRLYDLDEGKQHDFHLSDLYQHVRLFGFIAGYQTKSYGAEDAVNVKAAERMGLLHDQLKAIGYEGHELEVYLVRLLFCLFAEDTSIFEKRTFQDFIEQRTQEDGSDLAGRLSELFQVLNTPVDRRFKNLDEQIAAFPYVNGNLFAENLPVASFDRSMRQVLLECCGLDWSKISPAIFGSMFQSVMNPVERRNLGAHYTSETNILKVIRPLFLDELRAEFEAVRGNSRQLAAFHQKLSTLRFLDPACGCGNFLIITYRELRALEIDVIKVLQKGQMVFNVSDLVRVDVSQFFGIEFEEFPARIAEVALWLMDHQMNLRVSEEFGEYYARLPLRSSATIRNGNALAVEWADVVPPDQLSYILGNPPFLGKQMQNAAQKADMERVFAGVGGAGVLDYVAAWYVRAAQYVQNTRIRVAFVSTNSISQGEQVGILWHELFTRYGIKIHFAHRTFRWQNEAKGNAAVHVVIIGFGAFDVSEKRLFEYDDTAAEPHERSVRNINPYLVEGKDLFISKRRTPVCPVPEMAFGSMPNDGGNLIIEDEELHTFLTNEPEAQKFIRPFIGSYEFINGQKRWCLWLKDAAPADLRRMPELMRRVEAVKQARLASNRPTTKKLADTPTLFGEIRQPDTNYIAFPEVSSERRKYVPVGFISKEVITSNKNYTVATDSLFVFGILHSEMHMSWLRYVGGRMKSDYSYSAGIVYNNFPWPESPTDKQKAAVEAAAQKVLDTRAQFPGSSLADLYDPLLMPPSLTKAHQELDRAVDACYRPQPFPNEAKRIEYLFDLYDRYTAGLFATTGKKKKK